MTLLVGRKVVSEIAYNYYLPPTKEEVYVFARTLVCLFVCMSVCMYVCLSVCKITQKRVHGFG